MIRGKDYIGVGVGAVILNDKAEILLLLRNKPPEKNFWSIPGGSVEFLETIEDAVIREVEEEIGLKIEIERLLGVTNHILEQENSHWVSPVFLAKIISGEVRNIEPSKHLDIGWFPLADLPENITLTTREAVGYLKD